MIKKAIILGASSGLGQFISNKLVKLEWVVHGIGSRIKDDILGEVLFEYQNFDLGEQVSQECLDYCESIKPDLFISCVADYKSLHCNDLQYSDMLRSFTVNSFSPFFLANKLLANLNDKHLSIIFINSEAAYHADVNSALYSSSKAALKVLASSLADSVIDINASVSNIFLGPLEDQNKINDIKKIAASRQVDESRVRRVFLKKSNPNLVINDFITFESCFQMCMTIFKIKNDANGFNCNLDGGSSGSL